MLSHDVGSGDPDCYAARSATSRRRVPPSCVAKASRQTRPHPFCYGHPKRVRALRGLFVCDVFNNAQTVPSGTQHILQDLPIIQRVYTNFRPSLPAPPIHPCCDLTFRRWSSSAHLPVSMFDALAIGVTFLRRLQQDWAQCKGCWQASFPDCYQQVPR